MSFSPWASCPTSKGSSRRIHSLLGDCSKCETMEETFDTGIDVSHWQGEVDWKKVKDVGIKFAVAKATEGEKGQDESFPRNWEGMKKNGIRAGAYHYFLGGESAANQIVNIREVLHSCGFDSEEDVLAIDVEKRGNEDVSPEMMADALKKLIDGLEKNFKNIFIYCSPCYWENEVDWETGDFSLYKLWIADYSGKQGPRVPTTWKDKGYTWWQFTDKGSIDGIQGFVDLDRTTI